MANHSSASVRVETPHETETTPITISDALRRRAQSVINDRSVGVFCVSVVDEFRAKTHHRDTENTEVAQRNQCVGTFCATPFQRISFHSKEIVTGDPLFCTICLDCEKPQRILSAP